jgi:hypothetical protein
VLVRHGRLDEALVVIDRTLATPERPGVFEERASRSLVRLRAEIEGDMSSAQDSGPLGPSDS